MDCSDFSAQEVRDTFRFIEPVNRWFGGYRPLVAFFERESKTWDPARTMHILDVGCGAGDVPAALVRWAQRTGRRMHVHAIDSNPDTARLARERCRAYPEITVAQANVFELRGAPADYVTASMFVHHFPNETIPAVFEHLLAHCKRKVVINDLLRSPLAYLATWLFSLPASRVFRHDARLSVRRGFSIEELHRLLLASAQTQYLLETHFFYRFLLVLSKEATS